MVKGEACFSILLSYVTAEYKQLKELALIVTNLGNSKFEWVFRGEDIERVKALLGKPIEVNICTALENNMPPIQASVKERGDKQGEGYFKLVEANPTEFVLETVLHKKTLTHRIPTGNVIMAWRIIQKQPLNKYVHCWTVAKNICEAFKIYKWHRDNLTFNGKYFNGDRKPYNALYYFPIKVLQALGVIDYTKRGKIARLVESFDIQQVMR